MTEGHDELFELGSSYDEMLQRGLDLAGESKDFFIDGRIAHLRSRLAEAAPDIESILDFGCGVGDATSRLADAFEATEVVGVDVAAGAIEEAQRRTAAAATSFSLLDELPDVARFDLCYVNGAYHHIPPAQRLEVTRRLLRLLRPGGRLALFENNPWSIPARLVMRRIPFDRDAQMLRPATARQLLCDAGFDGAGRADYLFFFPAALRRLQSLEPRVRAVPLGAQYLVVGTRPRT